MKVNNDSSRSSMADNFLLESDNLMEKISQLNKNLEGLRLEEIIELYFQVINLSSIAKSIKNNKIEFKKEFSEETLIKIQKTENSIDKKFNITLHPLLMDQLEMKIENFKNDLKKRESKQTPKTKMEIEDQAKKFEELRKLMSTKEFLNQYNESLKNST